MIKIDLVEKFFARDKCYMFIVNEKYVLSVFEAELRFRISNTKYIFESIMKNMYGENINVKNKILWMEQNTNLSLLLTKIIN